MAKTSAATVEDYLEALPPERRHVVATLREFILARLPRGYEEYVNCGMIWYCVPLERFPDTYNGQPLGYVALAAQKNYFSLYLMRAYGDPRAAQQLRDAFRSAGKKLDMGKSCVRFRALDDLPLPAIGELIAGTSPEQWIATYEAIRKQKR